eukprot:scaffold38116_cov19-Tisochrysis_lutea.AAC.1
MFILSQGPLLARPVAWLKALVPEHHLLSRKECLGRISVHKLLTIAHVAASSFQTQMPRTHAVAERALVSNVLQHALTCLSAKRHLAQEAGLRQAQLKDVE